MDYKIKVLELLQKGYKISEISNYLLKNRYETNSKSSIEKYLQELKKKYGAKTMFQLGYLIFKEQKK